MAKTVYAIPDKAQITPSVLNNLVERTLEIGDLVYKQGSFYVYTEERVWKKKDELDVEGIIRNILGNKASEKRIRDVLGLLRIDCNERGKVLKIDMDFINLRNGLFNIETSVLQEHDRDIFSTSQLPILYDQKAESNLWIKTLNQIFEGDQDKIALIQEIFGYCFTYDTSQEKAFFLFGRGRNGKSVITYVLEHAIDQVNCSSISLGQLGKDFYKSQLKDKLANISTETGTKLRLDEANFKSLVSGERQTGNEKFKSLYDFDPHAKFVVSMNELPIIGDKSEGSWERIIILKFNRYFKPEERNKRLKFEIVEKELGGIFLWAMEGLQRLRKRGEFTIPKDSMKELDELRRNNNTAQIFIEEEYLIVKDCGRRRGGAGVVAASNLYSEYLDWCEGNKHTPESSVTFPEIILTTFAGRIERNEDSKGRYYIGLKKRGK